MVTSAGNMKKDACDYNPGRYSKVITVGGTDGNNKPYTSTNWGTCVDIFAPGQDLRVAGTDYSNTYLYPKSGTSYAAPLVSGAVAMLLEEDGQLKLDEIKNKLLDMSQDDVLDLQSLDEDSPNKLLYVRGMYM